jgi:phospholipase/lecithinase/hemolysin
MHSRYLYLTVFVVLQFTIRTSGFSQMVVFGDSLSDVGNVSNATFGISPGSSYYNGRFSNGPLWVEDLAGALSLTSPTYSRSGGTDWAYGGAHTGPGSITHVFFTFPNVQTQINNYLNANNPDANKLFVVWAGGNDFIDGGTNPSSVVTNTANEITSLADRGATNFIVPNLPLLGEVPRFKGTAGEAGMTSLSSQFNSQLASTLAGLKSSLNINIYPLDVQAFFADVLANPGQYGFTNVSSPALNGSTVVPNPDQYLFWDDIHPTRVAHQLLAGRAADLVNTHNWVATGIAGWSTPANWSPAGVPTSSWIVNLSNPTAANASSLVSANTIVAEMTVGGNDPGTMNVLVGQNVAVTVAKAMHVGHGGIVTLSGGSVNAGALYLAPDATFHVDLAAADVNSAARVNIGSIASLGGSVQIGAASGFIPLPGQSFELMSFGSRSGDVAIVNETDFAGLRFARNDASNTLSVLAWALAGDANLDALVDTTDFNLLASNFNATGANWLQADFNADMVVDTLDFNALAANFGQATPPQSAGALGTAVPEPSAPLILMICAALATRRSRTH